MVWFARREDGWEADSERVLRAAGIPVGRLSPEEGRDLFPDLAVDDLAFILHEPEAGVLRAAGRRARAGRASERGRARVLRADARPEGAAVVAGGARLEADAVVWACGAWLARLFPGLVRCECPSSSSSSSRRRPSGAGPAGSTSTPRLYGHARVDPFGFKVGPDFDGREVDPDQRPLRGRAGGPGRRARLSRPPLPGARRRARGECPGVSLQPHTATASSSSPRIPSTTASGCSAAARVTATSTDRRWPSTRPRCWPAGRPPSRASRSGSAARGAACGPRGSGAEMTDSKFM